MKNYDEMNSKKSERRSRRSSILKAPKPRQPLQNVELSPSSSTENSPSPSATKVRRRVSFAEKKHVKEFCASVEQGTVWDNTYEENDSSHMRNSPNSNNDENIVPNGKPNDLSKELVDAPLQSIDSSRTSTQSTQDKHVDSVTLKTVASSIDFESVNTLNTKDIEYHETSGMECDLELTDAVGFVEHVEAAPMLKNKEITIFHDNSIDTRPEEIAAFPQIPQTTESETNTELSTRKSMIPRKDSSEKTMIFLNKSMDFTEVVKNISTIETPRETSPERTTIFHNISVDFTEIVENIKDVEKPLAKTSICFNNTVDFTEMVENIPRIERLTPEKTIVFHDKSIDFTEAIDNLGNNKERQKATLEKTMIFNNVFVDMTEAISNIPRIEKASTEIFEGTPAVSLKNCIDSNGTNWRGNNSAILHDQSMQMTKAIPSVLLAGERIVEESPSLSIRPYTKENCLTNRDSLTNYQSTTEGKTMVFHDDSMELTGAVEFPLQTIDDNPLNKGKKLADVEKDCRTMIFHDGSMEFTQVQSSSKAKPIPARDKENCLAVMDDCPREDVPRDARQSRQETIDDNPLNKGKKLADIEKDCKTMIFHDGSMEFTQVQSSLKTKPIPARDKENCLAVMDDCPREDVPRGARQSQKETIDENPLNKGKKLADVEKDCRTMIFHDVSMEFTQVQSSSKAKPIPARDKENCLAVMDDCPREDVPRGARQSQKEKINDNPLNKGKKLADIEKDCRTMIFHDGSMEFTQVQSSLKTKPIPARDKENCLAVMDDCPREDVPRGARQSQKENILETLENKFMKMIASVKFTSLREKEENLEDTPETTERQTTHDCLSQDISGVSPLNLQTKNFDCNKHDVENLEKSSAISKSRKENMELSRIEYRPEQTETNSIDQGSEDRSSESSKSLFPNFTLSLERIEDNVSKDTNFEMRNSVKNAKIPNTTGFDEEAFSLQRALCLKSHEADSMASQESNSRGLTSIEDQRISINDERQKLSTETMKFPSGTKLVEDNEETIASRFSTTVERTECDKSLEELRARASSVIRFCPEDTAYEFTERINRVVPLDFNRSTMSEDLQTEEPPSFGFAYSISEDSLSSPNASSNEPDPLLDEEKRKSVPGEIPSFQVSQLVERKSVPSPIAVPELPEITTTLVQQIESYKDVTNKASPMERMVRKEMHRSQRRNDVSVPEVNLSSFQPDRTITDCVKNHSDGKIRLTTTAEFSSESIDGPAVKLRRGDSDVTKEETSENEKRSVVINDPWSNRYFANSTAIGNDFEQESTPHDNDDNFVPVKNSFIDELPSIIVSNKGQNFNDTGLDEATERIDDNTRDLEMSGYKSSFLLLKETIENLSKRFDVIWDINRLDEKIVAFNFFSKSIVLAIYLGEDSDSSTTNCVKDVVLLSQLVKEKTDPGLCLAHDLIMKKMDNGFLKRSCESYEQIPELLEHVSSRVKLGMDFAFELDRLRNHNVMEIDENRITFLARTSDINAGIILNVTMVIKPFEEIDHDDITVSYLLGGEKISKNYIERLITNVKRDHRFLRFYIADVKDYIDLMAETASTLIR